MTPPFLPLPMLGRLYDSVPQFLQPLQFRMTRTLDELTASASLVYREYAARRYVVLSSTQMKLSIYHALPTTTTCVHSSVTLTSECWRCCGERWP